MRWSTSSRWRSRWRASSPRRINASLSHCEPPLMLAMALTDANDLARAAPAGRACRRASRRGSPAITARRSAWRARPSSSAWRARRSVFLSQILLARWMGSFEFGTLRLRVDLAAAGRRHRPSRRAAHRAALHPANTRSANRSTTCAASDRQPLDHLRRSPPPPRCIGALRGLCAGAVARPQRHPAALSRLRRAAVLRAVLHARRHRAVLQLDRARR